MTSGINFTTIWSQFLSTLKKVPLRINEWTPGQINFQPGSNHSVFPFRVLHKAIGAKQSCKTLTITMALKQVVKLIAVTIFSCIYSTLVFISLFFRPKWLIGGFFKKSKSDHPPKCLSDPSLGTHGYIHLEVRNEAYLACVRQDSVFYIIKLKTLLILASLYKL